MSIYGNFMNDSYLLNTNIDEILYEEVNFNHIVTEFDKADVKEVADKVIQALKNLAQRIFLLVNKIRLSINEKIDKVFGDIIKKDHEACILKPLEYNSNWPEVFKDVITSSDTMIDLVNRDAKLDTIESKADDIERKYHFNPLKSSEVNFKAMITVEKNDVVISAPTKIESIYNEHIKPREKELNELLRQCERNAKDCLQKARNFNRIDDNDVFENKQKMISYIIKLYTIEINTAVRYYKYMISIMSKLITAHNQKNLDTVNQGAHGVSNFFTSRIASRSYFEATIADDDKVAYIKDLISKMTAISTKRDSSGKPIIDDLDEYNKLHKEFTDICNIPNNVVIKKPHFNGYKFKFGIVHDRDKDKVTDGKYLVHTSSADIDELYPSLGTPTGSTFYPEPRVYFYNGFDGRNRKGEAFKAATDGNLYQLANQDSITIHNDNEIHGNACFVVTEKPIKVVKVPPETVEKWTKVANKPTNFVKNKMKMKAY